MKTFPGFLLFLTTLISGVDADTVDGDNVVHAVDDFESPMVSEQWKATPNTDMTIIESDSRGFALRMEVDFSGRVNGYAEVSFDLPEEVGPINALRFRYRGDGTTTRFTHWMRGGDGANEWTYHTGTPLTLRQEHWQEVLLPLEFFNYPTKDSDGIVAVNFILTQEFIGIPPQSSTVELDQIEFVYDPYIQPTLVSLETDEDLFAHIDMTRPELASVQEAYAADNIEGAKEALVSHLVSRQLPLYYMNYSDAATVQNAYAESYGRDIMSGDKALAARVDDLEAFTFKAEGQTATFPDGDIEWNHQKAGKTWTWSAVVQRHASISDLAKAYLATGDERYASLAMHIFEDFNEEYPVGQFDRIIEQHYGWHHSLNVAERLRNWLFAYEVFKYSPTFGVDQQIDWLKRIIEHAQWLDSLCEQGFRFGNPQVSEASVLQEAAILFPEFTDSPGWLSISQRRLTEHAEREIYPDGAFYELAPGYHAWVAEMLVNAFNIAEINNVPMSETFREQAGKAYEWTGRISTPSGHYPAVGDTAQVDTVRQMAFAAAVFERPDFKLMARGASISPKHFWFVGPDGVAALKEMEAAEPETSAFFANPSRFITFRSDWGRDADYVFFNIAPDGGVGHGHPDSLSLDVAYGGQRLLEDPGMAGYSSPYHVSFYRKTRAHSVLMINGQDMPNVPPEFVGERAGPYYDYAGGKQSYQDGTVHERRVWFLRKPGIILVWDRVHGSRNAHIEQLWRFRPGLKPVIDSGAKRAYLPADGRNGLAILQDPNRLLSISTDDGLVNFKDKPGAVVYDFGAPELPFQTVTLIRPLRTPLTADTEAAVFDFSVAYPKENSPLVSFQSEGQSFQFSLSPSGQLSFHSSK